MIATDKELTKRLWAKTEPRKSLWGHLRETAAVMKGLLTEAFPDDLSLLAGWMNVSREEARQLCQYLAALHDIGKCHPSFQIKEEGMGQFITESPVLSGFLFKADYRHEKGSRFICTRIWFSKKRFDKWAARAFSDILALHHQGKGEEDQGIKEGSDLRGAAEWIAQQDAIEERAFALFRPPYINIRQMPHVDAACTVMTGLVIMADWLSSSEWFSGDTDAVTDDELDAKVSDVIRRIGLDGSVMPDCHEYAERFPWITAGRARPLQTSVAELLEERADMPLLMILEAPMGEGKTEAGLFAANRMASGWNKKGIYVGLPTAATANQMVGRVDAMLSEIGSDKARLLHSMAWLDEEPLERVSPSDDAHDLAGWLNPSRRALLGQYAVGTVDQAMMAALKVKYGVLRLLGLTGKVLVIDEIHAYDAYMATVIQRLTEWCMVLRIPVVMMSATLPEHTKRQYLSLYGDPGPLESGYPMVTAAYRDGTIVQRPVTGTFKHGEVGIRLTEDDEAHNVTADTNVRLAPCFFLKSVL